VCGNGVIERDEFCDPPSSCPTTCADDGDACTTEKLVGMANLCDARCLHTPVLACSGSTPDRCCPTPGCSAKPDISSFDTDCAGSPLPRP
jgi:hypothetical protein